MPAERQDRQNYPLIDVLRAVAALLVVIYHVIVVGHWAFATDVEWTRIFNIGWIGVDCFFVISGFVITLSALKDFERLPMDYRAGFALRRLARIVPLYVLTMVLYIFLVKPELLLASNRDMLIQVASHLLFVHNLFPATGGSINSPSWSIGLEMQFYALILMITPWLSRVSIVRMLFTMIAVGWTYRYLITFIFVPGGGETQMQFFYTTQLPGTLDEFGMGMAFALAVHHRQGFLSRILTPGWRNCAAWWVLALMLTAMASGIFWPRANYWHLTSMIVFWRTLLAATFAAWLAVAMTLPIAEWSLFKPARYLGQISYGIYLWHMLVLETLISLPVLRDASLFWHVLIGTTLLASLSWHLLEKPIMERYKTGPRRSAVQPVPGRL